MSFIDFAFLLFLFGLPLVINTCSCKAVDEDEYEEEREEQRMVKFHAERAVRLQKELIYKKSLEDDMRTWMSF